MQRVGVWCEPIWTVDISHPRVANRKIPSRLGRALPLQRKLLIGNEWAYTSQKEWYHGEYFVSFMQVVA